MAHHTYDYDQIQNLIKEIPDWHNTVKAMKTSTDGVILPPVQASIIGPSVAIPGVVPPSLQQGGFGNFFKRKDKQNDAAADEEPTANDDAKANVADEADKADEADVDDADDADDADDSGKKQAKKGGKEADLSRQEVVGNVFTYIYLFLAIIGIFATLSMVVFSWLDVSELSNDKRVLRPDENMLLFKDTIEHSILGHTKRFNVFSEGTGSLNIVMEMGINMLILLLIQMLLTIIIKVALNGGNMSDAVKGFKNMWFAVIIVLYALQLMLVLVYYFEFNRKKFNGQILGRVFQDKITKMKDLRTYIKKNLYNGPLNMVFYRRLVNSVHDHGRTFRTYLADNAKKLNSIEVAKMMFTFNVFNFYVSQYNTVENFVGTPMYRFFAGTPANSPDIDILQYINVLAVSGGGMTNVFAKHQVSVWYSRMYPDPIQRDLALVNSWENRIADQHLSTMMSDANAMLVSTMMEFNWTQYIGAPSNIYKTFQRFLSSRFIYWFFTQLVLMGLLGLLIWAVITKRI